MPVKTTVRIITVTLGKNSQIQTCDLSWRFCNLRLVGADNRERIITKALQKLPFHVTIYKITEMKWFFCRQSFNVFLWSMTAVARLIPPYATSH